MHEEENMNNLAVRILLVALVFGGAAYLVKTYNAVMSAKLAAEVSQLSATVESLKEQNAALAEQKVNLESIKSQIKQLVCEPAEQRTLPTEQRTLPTEPIKRVEPTANPAAPAIRNDEPAPTTSSNPAANMNAQPVASPIHFPFDLPADKQRQMDDMMARHNVESLTEFQERFAGRKADPVELAQFAKERKDKLLANLRVLLDDEQYQQAETMLMHDKN
jgi:cell division protein FtsB